MITSHSTPEGMPTDQAFTYGFWVCAGVAVLAVLASLALPSARLRRQEALAHGVTDLPEEPVELHLPHRHEKSPTH